MRDCSGSYFNYLSACPSASVTRTRAVTCLGVRQQFNGLSLLQGSCTSQTLMTYGSSTNRIRIAKVVYPYFELESPCLLYYFIKLDYLTLFCVCN